MAVTRVLDILRESLPLMLVMAMIEVIAGSFLGRMEANLEQLPGLLALIPAVLAMRGNISTSMGSRFGTMTRFGMIPKDRFIVPAVTHSIVASLVLGVILSVAAAGLAHGVTILSGLPSAGFLMLAAIATVAGLVSGVVMGGVALVTMRVAFRRGLDLDNVAGPVLMTMSDLFTLLCLAGTAQVAWMVAG
jgi:mgtE-like transporter